MKVSRLGLLFLARREGLCLTAYQDGEHLSIGFGSNDPKLKPGDTITAKRAFELLKEDVAEREPIVDKALKVPVSQHVYDALFSLYYQGGSDGLKAVADLINDGKMVEAADEFLKWDTNAAGKHMKGLLKRREMERQIFLNADYGDLNPVPMWLGNPREGSKRLEYFVKDTDL